MKSPWLDTRRFPGRAFLSAVRRAHAPLAGDTAGDAGDEVRGPWAAHLGVAPEDLLLCTSAEEAWHLVFGALLAPGDTVLLAEPAPPTALAVILACEARYVDVGRRQSGAVDAVAASRALAGHPQAVLLGEAPSLFGTDDAVAWAAIAGDHGPGSGRGLLLDARADPTWGGRAPAMVPGQIGALATIVALRDPDRFDDVLAFGIVCAPGTGVDLSLLQGRPERAQGPLRQAWSVLADLAADPHWPAAADAEIQCRRAAFAEAVADQPGVHLCVGTGLRAVAECRAGNAAETATRAAAWLAPVHGFAGHPTRALVVADLTVARIRRESDGAVAGSAATSGPGRHADGEGRLAPPVAETGVATEPDA